LVNKTRFNLYRLKGLKLNDSLGRHLLSLDSEIVIKEGLKNCSKWREENHFERIVNECACREEEVIESQGDISREPQGEEKERRIPEGLPEGC